MAGHHKSPLAMDPALIKYNNMYINRHKYFRWNRKTATIGFMYMVAVPFVVGYIGYKTEGLWEMRGKRRGDTIVEF